MYLLTKKQKRYNLGTSIYYMFLKLIYYFFIKGATNMNSSNDDLSLAVLIDADNVPYSNVKGMIEEIARYGTP